MKIHNVKRWSEPGLKPYIVASLGVVFAFCLRYTLHDYLQTGLPMTFFIVNTVIITLLYGYKPSIFTMVISVPLASYFFLQPFAAYTVPTSQDIFHFFAYILIGLIAVGVIEWLQRARYKAVLISRVATSRYRLLAKASSSLKKFEADSMDLE